LRRSVEKASARRRRCCRRLWSGPLRVAQIAATRRSDVYKSVIGRDQAVAVDEALKSFSANATH
jgi:hypothetical protein